MLYVATVHYRSPRWIEIQTSHLREHIKEPLQIWSSLEHIDPRWVQTIRVVDRGLRSHEFVGAGDVLRVLPGSSKAALWVPDQTFVSAGAPLQPGDSYAAEVYAARPSDAPQQATAPASDGAFPRLAINNPFFEASPAKRK